MKRRKLILALAVIAIISITTAIFYSTQPFYIAYTGGLRYFSRGEYSRAADEFSRARALKPRDTKILRALIQASRQLGRQDESCRLLQSLSDLIPGDNAVREELADAYYTAGDYPRAESQYRLLDAAAGNIGRRRKLAEVIAWQGRYQEALPLLEAVCAQQPGEAGTQELLADLYSWMKRYDDAVAIYTRILPGARDRKALRAKLADALRFAGRDEEAVAVYRDILKE